MKNIPGNENLMIKTIILILSILLISACAPRYKIIHDYIPPASNSGLNCLKHKCHKQNLHCQKQCQIQQLNCQIIQEQNAKRDYSQMLMVYYSELELFETRLDMFYRDQEHYRHKKKRLEHKKKHAFEQCKIEKNNCSEYKYFKKKLKKLNKPYKPNKPYIKTLQQTITEYQQSCADDCQCNEYFNQCYVSCGGYVNTRKICIDYCD